jgi:hypothetical protein
MKMITTLVLVAGGLLLGPQLLEGTSSSCAAIERRIVIVGDPQHVAIATFVASLFNGRWISARASQLFPKLPPFLSCSILYWSNSVDGWASFSDDKKKQQWGRSQ